MIEDINIYIRNLIPSIGKKRYHHNTKSMQNLSCLKGNSKLECSLSNDALTSHKIYRQTERPGGDSCLTAYSTFISTLYQQIAYILTDFFCRNIFVQYSECPWCGI